MIIVLVAILAILTYVYNAGGVIRLLVETASTLRFKTARPKMTTNAKPVKMDFILKTMAVMLVS